MRPNFHLQWYGGLDIPTEPLAESDYKGRIKSNNKNKITYFKSIDKLARKQKKKKKSETKTKMKIETQR